MPMCQEVDPGAEIYEVAHALRFVSHVQAHLLTPMADPLESAVGQVL